MVYLYIDFEGNYGTWGKLTQADKKELADVIPGFPEDVGEFGPHDSFLITDESLPVLSRLGLTFKVSDCKKSKSIGQMLVKLQDRIHALELTRDDQKNTAQLVEQGAMVQVTVPGFELLSIVDVDYMEDACTDELQIRLNNGWKILAVCPPNAQRRPDYILGRSQTQG